MSSRKPTFIRLNVSMVSIKWGDVLSTLLPGAVALFAVAQYFPALNGWIQNLNSAGTAVGLALLIGSALCGGVLEAFTRIGWERWWLMRRCKPPDSLKNLKLENLELYERGVQGSYKYVTFYANFAWATLLLLIKQMRSNPWSIGSAILLFAAGILLWASHIQWTYYVNYQQKLCGGAKFQVEE